MEQSSMTIPVGTRLQKRFFVERLLGQGGFGTVYLVRDQKGKYSALKELIDQGPLEHERFLNECKLLERLDHPALPTVYQVFQEDNQTYLLMEYVEGPNLDVLRKEQPGRVFPLAEVLRMLTPIVEAVAYLHRQNPPVIHRDVKPSNIVVPTTGGKAVLVDFGIAKEYYPDATTTALRHCSPGYSAPEQYSSIGTDTRSDIYGLGATCYTLLAGVSPTDALQRMTNLAGKGVDPLIPLNELVPGLPLPVANAIRRSLSISHERRFATVEDFWLQMHTAPSKETEDGGLDTAHEVGKAQADEIQRVEAISSDLHTSVHPAETEPLRAILSKSVRSLILAVVALLLILGLGLGYLVYARPPSQSGKSSKAPPVKLARPIPSATRTATGYLVLAPRYAGTMHDLLTQQTGRMTLVSIQQNNQIVQGDFISSQTQGIQTFSGVLDTSTHLLFTVKEPPGQRPLFFEGTVRSDGYLVGNYCQLDQSNQCIGDYGIWSVAPSSK